MARRSEGSVTMVNLSAAGKASCAECAHSGLQLQKGEPGRICRRNPPQPQGIAIPQPGGLNVQVITLWPIVQSDDWCAEFCPNPVSTLSN
jgi:hypothetical protein